MEVFFVNDYTSKSGGKARSFLAKNAIKKRLTEQKRATTTDRSTVSSRVVIQDKEPNDTRNAGKVAYKPTIETNLTSQHSPVSIERPIYKRTAKSGYGVSNASCPNPAQAGRIAFRTSCISSLIQSTIDMASKAAQMGKWENPEEQKKMHILALTYRGEAMKIARNQLSAATRLAGKENSSSTQRDRDLFTESQFKIILQLVLMDYFCFPTQASAHFAASRELVRSFMTASSIESIEPVNRRPSFIHNRQLHHIVTAFESTHFGPESLVWDPSDIPDLRDNLYRFMHRLLEASSISVASESQYNEDVYKPRIDPQSLVWRSVTKIPGGESDNPLSEFNGQLAIIMILCSIFMDYEPSTLVPKQCLNDLEDALLTLGEEEALTNALNIAWMVAGGLGMPIESGRQRLWSTMGMMYVFRRREYLVNEDESLMHRLDNQCELTAESVKLACLEFLAAHTPY